MSSLLLRAASFVLSLVSRLVRQLLPGLSPAGIEHQIIASYFLLLLSLCVSLGIVKLTQRFSSPSSNQLPSFHRSIVDIYIDFNHFHPHSTHHSIRFLLLQFKSIVHQSLQNSSNPPRLVFWCYIDRDRPELSDWINQLDQLESHFQHGFVQVIDTSQKASDRSTQKPLLNDLLKILNVSPPGRIYVVSTSDPDICGAGIQLMKNHPNSPVVAYIPPHGSSIELAENVDYMFSWEDDETIRLVQASPTRLERAVQEFEPLHLILEAYSQSDLPLETLKDYLRPWCSKFGGAETDHDDQVNDYVDSAIANGIISISEQSAFDQNNPTRLVVFPGEKVSHLSSECPSNHPTLSSLPAEKVGLDDDNLTTTESDTSDRSSPSSQLKVPIELPEHPPLSPAQVNVEKDHILTKHQSPLKHKHHSLDLNNDVTEPPIKKNRNQSVKPASSPTIRSGYNALKKKSLVKSKNNHVKAVVIDHSVQSESWVEKHTDQLQALLPPQRPTKTQPILETSILCDAALGLNNQLETSSVSIEKNEPVSPDNNVVLSGKRLRFSTVWLNCSSGIIVNFLSSPGRSSNGHGLFLLNHGSHSIRFDLSSIHLLNNREEFDEQGYTRRKQDDDENFIANVQDTPASQTLSSHLHFKSFFFPAFFELSAPAPPHNDSSLKFNLQIHLNHHPHLSTPVDLNQVD